MNLDIQVVWRQWLNFPELNNPLKLANACSYGIPSVCYPEVSYVKEFDGCFVSVKTIDELVDQVKRLKEDEKFYDEMREKGLKKAEEYHIENISKYYRALDDSESTIQPVQLKSDNGGIRFRIYGDLLEKQVKLVDKIVPVYGLSHFRVSPRRNGLGTDSIRRMEEIAQKDGKYAVVAFCEDGPLEFYLKCGWHNNGKWGMYGQKNIVSNIPLGPCVIEEDW
jgi:hypothetical protein